MRFSLWMIDLERYREEAEVRLPVGGVLLAGLLAVPPSASGIVLFAHGSGSSRHSPRNRYVARVLREAGVGSLLFDLLTAEEEALDLRTARIRFDIELLASRLVAVTDWCLEQCGCSRLGYFGSSTGGAAALRAAIERPELVKAIVCRGSRVDLAEEALPRVTAPTLLVVGGHDSAVLEWNRAGFEKLGGEKRLEIVAGATHLFEEVGALEEVARLAAAWFSRNLASESGQETENRTS